MIFVTGGTGLVGKHILLQLAQKGKRITAAYRNKEKIHDVALFFEFFGCHDLFSKINWIEGDILNAAWLNDVTQDANEVYHCAALVSFNPAKKSLLYENNVKGTRNVVNAALINGISKLAYVSSTAAIGKSKHGDMIDENCEWTMDQQPSNYSISKYFSELEIWRGIAEGLNAVIVNPAIIFGAGDWNSGSNAIIKKVVKGLKFYTSGSNGFVNAKDVAKVMLLLMEKEIFNERFLLVSENKTYKMLFEEIAEVFSVPPPHLEAYGWQMKTLAVLESIRYRMMNSEPLITRETIQSSLSCHRYSNKKVLQRLEGFAFAGIQSTIKEVKEYQAFLNAQ